MPHPSHQGHVLIPERVGLRVVVCYCLDCACMVRVPCPEGASVLRALSDSEDEFNPR